MKLKNNFKTQLIFSFALIGLLPSILISANDYFSIKSGIEKEVNEKMQAIVDSKDKEISHYLENIKKQILTFSKTTHIIEASEKFIDSYNNIQTKLTSPMKENLLNYYNNEFNVKYKNEVGKLASIDALTSPLKEKDLLMQYAFISNNKNALGEKDKLDTTEILPNYSNVHKIYHPAIREYLAQFEYYDIFIIDVNTGRIVYSVFKELDFSTSLLDGPYKDSNLAKAYSKALQIEDQNSVAFLDFEKYTPSYEAPASFISTPIWKNNKPIAILAYQMPVAAINDIVSSTNGLGPLGEAYLVGEDNRLRSDLKNAKDYNIINSFKNDLRIKSSPISKALENGESRGLVKNVNGERAFQIVKRVDFEKSKWVIIAEILEKDSLKNLIKIRNNGIIFSTIIILVVIIFGYFLSNRFANLISVITEKLSKSAHEVQNASQTLSLASNKMNKSVNSQSDNLNQTASAIDEITSMLDRSTDSAKHARDLSSETKNSAQSGSQTVQAMLKEIELISESYDQISSSIESNNNDIGDIVNVITEISQKTNVINDIVFQTKLLSFNASVEAARAGEHGKGFAVVAEEVGNLATMSGNAADEIMSMLSGSIEKVNAIAHKTRTEVTKIVSEGKHQVDKGIQVANDSQSKLESIHQGITNLDNSISEIAAAAIEQQSGVNDIKSAIKSLEEATLVSKEMSVATDGSSNKLFEQSKELRNSIEKLRKLLGTTKNKNPA